MSIYPLLRRPLRTIGGEVDPYFSQVSLLVLFDGQNGSTNFYDRSTNNFALATMGSAQITTEQGKFNGTSGKFLASGAYVTLEKATPLFLPGDFTLEAWIYPISPATNPLSATRPIFGMWHDSNPLRQSYFLHLVSGKLRFIADTNVDDQLIFDISNVITSETWYHVAIVRSVSNFYCFVDGDLKATTVVNSTIPITSTSRFNCFGIGSYNRVGTSDNYSGGGDFYGYIDSLRLTKGVARYTANFSVPTSDFPTS